MEKTDPHSRQSVGEQSAEQGSELNISQVQPAQIEPQDAHWLRMDPSLTRAVLAKTEEELLGSLAALMRNKVEHEQASRRFAQVQIDTKQARHELESINKQIRRAEEEVAARLNEQSRINEEIVRVQQELVIIREGHQRHAEMVSGLQNEAALMQQLLAEAHRDLSIVKGAAETQLAAHQESIAQLGRLKNEKATLEESLAPLRQEVDERISAREALIAEAVILHQQVSDLATQKQQKALELADLQNEIAGAAMKQQRLQISMSEEQAQLNDLLDRKTALERAVAAATDKRAALHTEVTALETRLHELSEAAEKIEESRIAEGLPLLFGSESHKIAPEWDPYPLESEFHTDDVLDAKKVAELVSLLPGWKGA